MSRATLRTRLLAASAAVLAVALCAGAAAALAVTRQRSRPSAQSRSHCRHHAVSPAHPARIIWSPAFPRAGTFGFTVADIASRPGAGHASTARPCRRAKRKPAAKHGVSTTAPTGGSGGGSSGTPTGNSGSGGGATGSGSGTSETAAPGESSAPAEGGSGEGSTPPALPHVQVTAVEYHFTLSRATVPAGKVVFNFVNSGQDEHNLNVLSGEGSLTAQFPDTESKAVRNQTIEMRHGKYTLFCSLPEHESKGMKATLTVE